MIHPRYSRIAALAILFALFAAAAQQTQAENALSGRDLLRAMRDKEGHGKTPAYENRLKQKRILKESTSAEPPAVPEEFPGLQEPNTSQEPLAPAVSDISTKAATQPPGDQLLQMIPAESMFCVRVNNFDFTLSQIDQFLAGVSPMPMAVSILVRTQLAGMLGSPELNGVKMGGNFAIFGPLLNTDLTDPGNIGILVPVTDYKQFVGIPPMLVTEVEGYALISPQGNDNELIATAKSISASTALALLASLDSDDVKQAVEQPIWAYGNVQQASRTFGSMLSGRIEEMKVMMESIKANGQGPSADPSAIMNMYALILETLMKQTKTFSITVNAKPDVLKITKSITAVPGTDMANTFVADASGARENKLLAYLQDGAVMNFAGKMNTPFWRNLNIKSIDFYSAIGGDSISTDDTAKMKKLTEDAMDSLGGPVAFSFLTDAKSRPPFAFKYILEVKDADKLNSI
ncbi:MAG: hypothetical protein ACYTEQ_30460, partial [Planctomycetota bacterium]